MITGKGDPTEKWTLFNAWPSDWDWGGLDYAANDIAEVTIELVFDRAIRENQSGAESSGGGGSRGRVQTVARNP